MAKKKETKIEMEETPEVVIEQPKTVVKEKPLPTPTKKDSWEIKDRMYRLVGSKKPLSRMIRSANIYWFDEEKGYERELKY